MKQRELKAELERCLPLTEIRSGKNFRLGEHHPDWMAQKELAELAPSKLNKQAKRFVKKNLAELSEAQELLYASGNFSLLVIFQAMDAAGKDSAIKHVMGGINPQGCQVFSFKAPTSRDYQHNFLWRSYLSLPEKGRIGIFNRSYYEETLVTRVHPEYLEKQNLPPGPIDDDFWQQRYRDIRHFEEHLHQNGTVILKFFLHLSKEEQKQRLLARLANPDKHWKFDPSDVRERRHWETFQQAYEDCIRATATEYAPWYVLPSDHKWPLRAMVASIITHRIKALPLSYPAVDAEALRQAESELQKE